MEPRTYTKVTRVLDDGTEEVLLDNTQNQPEAVLSEETTWYINDMLKNVVTGKFGGATGTGAQLSGMTVAGKTGTTNSNNDKWFVGYTPTIPPRSGWAITTRSASAPAITRLCPCGRRSWPPSMRGWRTGSSPRSAAWSASPTAWTAAERPLRLSV